MVDMTAYFESFRQVRILCIGDIMLDHFMYGSVARISPEAPIPVLKLERETQMLGGVGNVVANLAALGVKTSVVATVGQDMAAEQIRAKLQDIRVSDGGLVTDAERPTSVKTRYLSGGQQLLRTDREKTGALSGESRSRFYEAVDAAIMDADIVVLSDYGKGTIDADLCHYVVSRGKRVIVDPKGRDYSCYKGAFLVTPNRTELADASDMATGTDEEVTAAAKSLMELTGVENILATRSKDGMSIVYGAAAKKDPVHIKTSVREVYDVSGAGDTVVAVMAAMLATGAELEAAASVANVAGGIVVGKIGTATVTVPDIKKQIDNTRNTGGVTREEALEQVERWRANGLTVGFTNGCFDLLHPGHISLLEQARARCDRLIVGLNTDASVRRLKGETRPIQNETARTTVLQALAAVDMVVLFDEDTPEQLIKDISPNLLVKGADYTIENVVGAAHVMSYGGEVYLAELTEGQSTTGMVGRMVA
ncbi:MAG: D-glycero-beta-D-manno-heptose-7-phosphate kinase [Pseudomonadota bacterium]|nr:D-glycero-beta-D-manno-heptose-7-phosphate kinase [Pseudomonadota bacterium]QKK04847.1 MAG: D-glycero-beta-D-manno-heptose-7-phosphate kinase [Pseudomonadota bacterium]